MSAFDALKRNRGNGIDKLVTAAEEASGNKSYGDDRFWTPTKDKAGNGYAVIRFLPAPANEELPWVRYWDHGFKGPTGLWYIENSLTSIGQDDPVSEANSKLWNTGREEDKAIARERKRRLHHVANILVISDQGNPSNNGKHFLFKFGKKIFDKINDAMQPEFADETPVNPFDLWDGANFKLKIRQVEGYPNYDKSEFDKQSELFKGDENQLKELYEGLYSLSEFTDPKKYKTYAELKTKFNKVIGETEFENNLTTAEAVDLDEKEDSKFETGADSYVAPAGDDADTDYFRKLANS